MPQVIQITSQNYEGQVALVTFYPCTGGTISLGYITIPYNYESNYYNGNYTLYFSAYNETCNFSVPCPTPSQTATKTVTPSRTNPKTTPTSTATKTPTPTTTPSCFCYKFSNKTDQIGKINYYNCDNKFTQTSVNLLSSLNLCVSLSAFTASSYVTVVQSGPCGSGKCVTPTPTPTVTKTNTNTPTVTKTNTNTPTVTKTPTSTKFPEINNCDVLYVTTDSQVFVYKVQTNTYLNLTPFFQGESIDGYNFDIAHTENFIWLMGQGIIQEWNIQISPFFAEFSRYITITDTNGDGLGVINDTTLLISRYSDVENIPNQIIRLDISNTTPSSTILFFLPQNRFVIGDISYNSQNKILILTQDLETNKFLTQYTTEGVIDVDIELPDILNAPNGLYTTNNNLIIVDGSNGQNYSINLNYPYDLTPTNSFDVKVGGLSQITSCFRLSFNPKPQVSQNSTPTITPTKTNTPTNTLTPTVTPTKCCLYFDLYGGDKGTGSTFQIISCDNVTSQVQVNVFEYYSDQYDSKLCAFNVQKLSGDGLIYNGGCGCVNPTPTQTPTLTPTPTNRNICLNCNVEGIGYYTNIISITQTPTKTITSTPTITTTKTPTNTKTQTPTNTTTKTMTPTNTQTNSVTPTTTSTPTKTSTPTITPTSTKSTTLGISTTISEPGYSIQDGVVSSNPRIFAFGKTGSTATTFVYTAQTPYSLVTSFSSLLTATTTTSEITDTYAYKAVDGEYLVEVIELSNYSASTLTISGFNDSWLSSYDSSANKLAIMSRDGSKLFFVDTTNNSTSEFSLTGSGIGSAYGYKGGITNDGAGKFYIVGHVGKLSVIDSGPSQVTYDISGTGEYQKITWDSTNSQLFIYSRDFIYVYGNYGNLITTINISSYSADTGAATASIIYNPDNDRVYVAFADVTNNLVVLKIKTDYTIESAKSDYGITVGESLKLKYNSNTGLVLTVNSSSIYLLQT